MENMKRDVTPYTDFFFRFEKSHGQAQLKYSFSRREAAEKRNQLYPDSFV